MPKMEDEANPLHYAPRIHYPSDKPNPQIFKWRNYTCNGCPDVQGCEYAWDDYNTDGDCLASK